MKRIYISSFLIACDQHYICEGWNNDNKKKEKEGKGY